VCSLGLGRFVNDRPPRTDRCSRRALGQWGGGERRFERRGVAAFIEGGGAVIQGVRGRTPGVGASMQGVGGLTPGVRAFIHGVRGLTPGVSPRTPRMTGLTRGVRASTPGVSPPTPWMTAPTPGVRPLTRWMNARTPGVRPRTPSMTASAPSMKHVEKRSESGSSQKIDRGDVDLWVENGKSGNGAGLNPIEGKQTPQGSRGRPVP